MIAAAAYAFIIRRKVVGIHDHASGRDLRIAAESRGDRLQGMDGDRAAKFGGTLPEIYDAGEKAFVSLEIDGAKARGYDRGSAGFYEAHASAGRVQLYDHRQATWFNYDVQDMESAADSGQDLEASH